MGLRDLFRRTADHAESPATAGRSDAPISRAAQLAEGGTVSVSNEEHYQDVLARFNGTEVVAQLVINHQGNPWVRKQVAPILEVQVGGETVGFLTTAMTARYIPLVESAAREQRPVTAKAWVGTGSGKNGRDVEITLNALPMWDGSASIAGLSIQTTVEYVLMNQTGRAHELDSEDGRAWVTKCGRRIEPGDGEVVYRTKPWVGRVRADGSLLPEGSPYWCIRCKPDTDVDEDREGMDGGSFGERTGISRDRRSSSRMTFEAVESALASRLEFDCAGESYRDGYPDNLLRLAEVLNTMKGDEWLSCVLRRDPRNEYDVNAIEIHVPGDAGHVGFVPGPLAKILAPMIDSGEVIAASAVEVRIHPESPDKPGLTIGLHREQRSTS